MSPPLLVDTCALIWLATSDPASNPEAVESAVRRARRDGTPIFVSPMTAWEIGMLVSRGRVPITMSPNAWVSRVMANGRLEWADLTPDILIASSFLPGEPHGDLADRIIMATARENGYRLVTRDRKILDYADKGHLMTLAC